MKDWVHQGFDVEKTLEPISQNLMKDLVKDWTCSKTIIVFIIIHIIWGMLAGRVGFLIIGLLCHCRCLSQAGRQGQKHKLNGNSFIFFLSISNQTKHHESRCPHSWCLDLVTQEGLVHMVKFYPSQLAGDPIWISQLKVIVRSGQSLAMVNPLI